MKTTLYFTLMLFTFLTLALAPNSFAQDSGPVVRLIYFVPSDRSAQPNIDERMDKLIKEVQEVFAGQMEHYGFGRKTFQFETDATGRAVVHHVKGKLKEKSYQHQSERVWKEIEERFDISTNIYLAALDTSTEDIDGFACGRGTYIDRHGGKLIIPASGWCFEENDVTVHELGHAFGLLHDFRNNLRPGIDLYSTEPMTTSPCAAGWLDAHRYFNDLQVDFDQPTTIEMLPPEAVDSDSIRFEITDLDGLHQVQLFVTVKYLNSFDQGILDCKSLDGSSNIVEFTPTPLVMMADSEPLQVITESVLLRVIDVHGNFTQHRFPIDITRLLLPPEVISIPDPILASAIRETLRLAPNHVITQVDMLKLDKLVIRNNRIKDLTGLEHATNLLFLSFNSIIQPIDFTPLVGLPKFRSLAIYSSKTTDITSLTGLTELSSLMITNSLITDITPLAGLTRLEHLDLRNNQISDITPLAGLTNLKKLILVDNPTEDRKLLLDLLRKNPGIKIYLKNASEPLPVTLSHFRAEHTDTGVVLKWTTESEVDNAGFYIYRSETKDGQFKVANPTMIQGAGTTSERRTYTWTDTTAKSNTAYYYRIEDVSHAGVRKQLATIRMRGLVSASGKLTIRWADLKTQN